MEHKDDMEEIKLEEIPDEKNNKIINTLGNIVSYGSSLIWNNNVIDLRTIADHDLLKINNQLSSIFSTQIDNNGNKLDFDFKLPQVVTVGGQSGGKSSTANGLLGLDLFLTGSGIVTRTPIHLQMTNDKDLNETKIEFIDNNNNIEKIISIGVTPTEDELNIVREEIKIQTIKRAGPRSGISDIPIIIRVSSPKIHDLSVVDLPGLTFEANADEDQAEDIDVQITNMIKKYIENPRSIILLIIQATNDIGSEATTKIVKSVDPKGLRTIGVFTKIDLMNKGTDVSRYLVENSNHNYYAIKNRSPKECKKYDISQSIKLEQDFFNNHPVYSKMENKNRLGIVNLVLSLKKILIEKIRLTMPDIIKEMNKREQEVLDVLKILGPGIPISTQEQLTRITILISDFCQEYNRRFHESDIKDNVGSQLKDSFDVFRQSINAFDPFIEYSDEYINNIMKNCQGDHMASPIPTITILEKCLKDPNKKPILKLFNMIEECLKSIQNIIINVVVDLCQKESYSRFPKFTNSIKEQIINKLLPKLYLETNAQLETSLNSENYYIWTDEPIFQRLLMNMQFDKGIEKEHPLKILLKEYYKNVKIYVKNNIPKLIKYCFVRVVEECMFETLLDTIIKLQQQESLLNENSETMIKRKMYETQRNKIIESKKILKM
jgi:hypothetical protein